MLELHGVEFSYPDTDKSIGPIGFSIRKGEVLSIIGGNGAGKSTIVKLIGGHLLPLSGKISLNGKSIENLPARKRSVATVFQSHALFPNMTVLHNVLLPFKVRGGSLKHAEKKAMEILDSVGMCNFRDSDVASLSGGESQRVALARALACEPDVLLLDEPMSSVDRERRIEFFELFYKLKKSGQLDCPVLLISHDPELVLALSDRIAYLHEGKIIENNSVLETIKNPSFSSSITFLKLGNSIPSNKIEAITNHHSEFIFIASSDVMYIEDIDTLKVIEGQLLKVAYYNEFFYCFIMSKDERVTLIISKNEPPKNTDFVSVYVAKQQIRPLKNLNRVT